MDKEELSKYFSNLSKKRKVVAGGFKSPAVRKKALKARKKNKAKNVQPEIQLLQDNETGQERQ